MKRIDFLCFVFVIVFAAFTRLNAAPADFDVIKNRVIETLLRFVPDDSQIEMLVKTIQPDGRWPGINYQDVSREGFDHSRHSLNMVNLARAYNLRSSKFFKSKKVKGTIEMALKDWVDNDYFCDNWWHNQIGTPDNLVALMLLIGNELPDDLVQKAQPIIGRAHLTASGARPSGDRIKIAGILAKNLLFIGDKKQFDEVIKVIEGEIKFSTGQRGLQHDFSFHHREDRVNNTLSYGSGYAESFAEWAAYVAGTAYAFQIEKINLLIDYYLDGMCKQMVFGKFADPGTKNRDISRPDRGRSSGTGIIERLMGSSDYRREELEEIMQIRKGEAAPIRSFSKFFWQTEHFVHQRPGWYASVRMHSTRNRNMEEPYNSEGLLNHHRGDGTNYLSITGEEYFNIAPVNDWQKIPGTTIMQKPALPDASQIQKQGLTSFVGAVTDGLYGAVAYDFKSPHDPVEGKKSWFFFDKEYVCLGAGISCSANLPVVTTLNQCRLNGEVLVGAGHGTALMKMGRHQLDHVNWVLHDGVGYRFVSPVSISLSYQEQSGSWWKINKQNNSSKEEVKIDIFKLWFDHGPRASNATYQYIVMPGATESALKAKPEIKVLANTDKVQAVVHTGLGIAQAVFYEAGELAIADGLALTADGPGLVMVKSEDGLVKEISVADPSRTLARLHLSVNQKIESKDENVRAWWNSKTGKTEIAVTLPKSVYAGSTVNIAFQ